MSRPRLLVDVLPDYVNLNSDVCEMGSALWERGGGQSVSVLVVVQGCQGGGQTGSDWPKICQIWDFLILILVNFGGPTNLEHFKISFSTFWRKNELKLFLKILTFVPLGQI